jgi:hypothetical protein
MEDEISEIIEDEEKSEKLNRLIEQKVEEKIEKKFKQRQKDEETVEEDEEVSRRGFLKKIGAGALGLGALSISPISAYDIKSSHGLEVWSEGNQHMEVYNGEIDLLNNNLTGVNQINGQDADNLGVSDHSNLSNVQSDQHHSQNHDNSDHTTTYLPAAKYNPEDDTHSRYSDSEAVSAVNSESSLNVDISGDADTVDGKQASELGGSVSSSNQSTTGNLELRNGNILVDGENNKQQSFNNIKNTTVYFGSSFTLTEVRARWHLSTNDNERQEFQVITRPGGSILGRIGPTSRNASATGISTINVNEPGVSGIEIDDRGDDLSAYELTARGYSGTSTYVTLT